MRKNFPDEGPEGDYWQRIAGGVRAELARGRHPATDLMPVLNLSRNSVYRRVNGEVPFDLMEIVKVCEWLGVPMEALTWQPDREALAS